MANWMKGYTGYRQQEDRKVAHEKVAHKKVARTRGKVMALAWLLGAMLLLGGCQNREKERQELRLLGISQLDSGDYEGAVASFEEALKKTSSGIVGEFELDILKYRAEAEYGAGDYQAAAYTYEILLQVDEALPEYQTRACLLSAMAGQTDKALELYGKLHQAHPDSPDTAQALLLLGQLLTEQGRLDEAMELYRQAVDSGVKSGEIYNRMGLCQMEAGDYDGALQYLELGIQTGDVTVMDKLLRNEAAVCEKKLDFARALSILEQYAAAYGATPEIQKEIDFLRTRQ